MANTNLPAMVERRLDVKDALKKIETSFPNEIGIIKNYLNLIVSQDVRVLGQDELFVIRSKTGKAVCVKRPVDLSVADGTLTKLGEYKDAPVLISAQGYERLGEKANINVLNPPTVVADGVDVHNPHVRRDDHGMITEVICRSIAKGYTATGMPAVSDRTSIFNINIYRIVDLVGKAKQNPNHFKILPNDMKPEGEGTWAKYPLDHSTSLWADTSHKDYITWIGQSMNRLKKAVEFAQTFAQRNALKHHPSIAMQKPPNNATSWRTAVFGWLQVDGKFMFDENVTGEMNEDDIIMVKGTDHIDSEEEMVAAMDAEDIAEDEQAEQQEDIMHGKSVPSAPVQTDDYSSEKTKKEEPPENNTAAGTMSPGHKKLQVAIDTVGNGIFQQAKIDLEIDATELSELSPRDCLRLVGRMNEIMDDQMGGEA